MPGIGCVHRGGEKIPGDTTLCGFRHPLQRNTLGMTLLKAVDEHLRRSDSDSILALAGHVANALERPDLLHRNDSRARRIWVAGDNEGAILGASDCDCADNGLPLCVVVESVRTGCAAGMRRAWSRSFVNGRARRGDPHVFMVVPRRPQVPSEFEAGALAGRGRPHRNTWKFGRPSAAVESGGEHR
jgi:hypothetical protein